MKKTCKDCGIEFTLTQGEIDFYKSKDFDLPERCQNCRDKRKGNNSNSNNEKNNTSINNILSSLNPMARVLVVIAFIAFATFPTLLDNFQDTDYTNNNSSYDSSYTQDNDYSNNELQFRNDQYLVEHFEKHGALLNHSSKESYLSGANAVINSTTALQRIQEDGDTAYYEESTNSFAVVSTDGYIRTYFKPNDGINYFNRQ